MYPYIDFILAGNAGKIFLYDFFSAIGLIVCIIKINKDSRLLPYGDASFYFLLFSAIASFFLSKYVNEFLFEKAKGYSYFAGLYLFLLMNTVWARASKIPLGKYMDAIAPYIPLLHFWGRIGCFWGGCCYGQPTQFFWGVIYDARSIAYLHLGDTPSHPVQLYEASCNLLIYLIVKNRMATNFRLITYLFCYGISRFVMEFFRYDHERGISATSFLTPSQLWATVSILLAITGYCIQHKQTLS